ncbi:MAG: small conductance mechanosensitive channel [Planctomycetota bacterium]|jgi:small conductance mechanosensitive channel
MRYEYPEKEMKMRLLVALLLATFINVGHAQAIDPKVDLGELKIQATGIVEGEKLSALADDWWKLIEAKDAEAKNEAKKLENEEADRGAINDKIIELEEERSNLVLRLETIADVLTAKKNTEKATSIANQIGTLKTHVDNTDPSVLISKAKAWLTNPDGGIRIGMNILMFFVIILGAKIIANIAAKILTNTMRMSRLKISDLLRDFFINATRKVIFFGGLIMALGRLGIDTAPLLAGIGVMGFVIGFALQGTLSNFASGVMILLYQPYDIGNVVSAAGATGKVTAMSLVSTTLTTPDNQIVIIPNSSIWGGVITNITGNSTRRVDLSFGIGYSDDIPKAMKLLEEIASNHELVHSSPAVAVQLHELADSSVNFVVRPWTNTGDYWAVYWDITRAVKDRFDAEGISFPFPQQDVHMHQVEA